MIAPYVRDPKSMDFVSPIQKVIYIIAELTLRERNSSGVGVLFTAMYALNYCK